MSEVTSPTSPTPAASFDVIGIDFGATNCRLTHLTPNKHMPVILRNSLGNENTPSLACFLPGQKRLAGEEAMGKEMSKPKSTINTLKQALLQTDAFKKQTAASTGTVSDDGSSLSFDVSSEFKAVSSDDEEGGFKVDAEFPYTQRAEQVLGFQLKQLLRIAPSTQQQDDPKNTKQRIVAISVPASASQTGYRNAIRAAARVAGIENLILVDETEATALYLHHLQFKQLPSSSSAAEQDADAAAPAPTRLAVVSIGEVSSFAMLIEATQSTVKILAQNSESNLGTRDIDNAIVDWAVAEVKKKSGGVDVSDHLKSMNKIRRDCSKAKVMLSTTDRNTMSFESLKDGIDVNVPITRSDMEQHAAPTLEKIRKMCTFEGEGAASSNGITRVEVIGNGWRAPCIQNAIKASFKLPSDVTLGMSLDANTAVAEGACIAATVRKIQEENEKNKKDTASSPEEEEQQQADAAAAAATENKTENKNGFAATHTLTFIPAADKKTEEEQDAAAPLDETLVAQWIEEEAKMNERDQFFVKRLGAKNNLETAVLSLMEIIDDVKFADGEGDKKRDALRTILRTADDWLRDFENATTEQFVEEKKKLDDAIKNDYPEVEAHYEKLREEQRKKDEELTKLAASRAEDKELKSDPQRLRVAGERREQGANLFKQEHWEEAQTRFVQAVAILQDVYDLENEEIKQQRNKILLSCYLNIASCGIRLQRWRNAANNASKAIEIDPNHPKAFFRRGQANVQLSEFDAAKQDLEKSLQLSNGDAAVKAELDGLAKKVEAQKQKEKKMFSKMFG